jgi:hypothetical protein
MDIELGLVLKIVLFFKILEDCFGMKILKNSVKIPFDMIFFVKAGRCRRIATFFFEFHAVYYYIVIYV